jgi:hypothetical protein
VVSTARRGLIFARQFIMPLRPVLVDCLRVARAPIWSAFVPTRNRIRLAEKLGVKVRVGREDDLAAFVRLFEETTARHGLRAREQRFVRSRRSSVRPT